MAIQKVTNAEFNKISLANGGLFHRNLRLEQLHGSLYLGSRNGVDYLLDISTPPVIPKRFAVTVVKMP